jgi:hypothetical protein
MRNVFGDSEPEVQLTPPPPPPPPPGGAGVAVGAAVPADDAEGSAPSLAEGATLASAEAEDSAEAEAVADEEVDADGWQAVSANSSTIRPDRDLTAQR